MRALPLLASLLATTPWLVACAAEPSPEFTDAESWQLLVEQTYQEAEQAGASAEQLSVIHDAKSDPEITFETVRSAVQRTLDCLELAGLQHQYATEHDIAGRAVPAYEFGNTPTLSSTEARALATQCMLHNSRFVEELYALQPSAVEAQTRALDAAVPAIVACLRASGISVDDDASTSEVMAIAAETAATGIAPGVVTDDGGSGQIDLNDPEWQANGGGGVDCIGSVLAPPA